MVHNWEPYPGSDLTTKNLEVGEGARKQVNSTITKLWKQDLISKQNLISLFLFLHLPQEGFLRNEKCHLPQPQSSFCFFLNNEKETTGGKELLNHMVLIQNLKRNALSVGGPTLP